MPPFMQPGKPSGDFRQNLTGASNGKITGANGGTQQLGANALRRLASGGGAAPAGPNMAGGGLNPGMPPPRTPPIMDPASSPNAGGGGTGPAPPLPGFSAAPGMTPYQPGGPSGSDSGSVGSTSPGSSPMTATQPGGGSGSVTGTMPGAGKLSAFSPGGQTPGIVPPTNGQGGSPNMGGAGPAAAMIAKLSGSGMSGLPGFQPAVDIGHAPGADPGGTMTMNGQPGSTPFGPASSAPGGDPRMSPGFRVMDPSAQPAGGPPGEVFRTQPGSTPWAPQIGGLYGGQAPDAHGGGGPLGGGDPRMSPGYHVGSPGDNTPTTSRPPMNTKPMPGRQMVPPTTSPWAGLGAAGGINPKPRFPSSGGNMASF